MEILNQLRGGNGKKISEMIERGVALMHEKAVLDEDIKQLAEDAKDEFEVKPAEFKKVVTAAFDEQVLVKKQEELTNLEDAVDIHKTHQS